YASLDLLLARQDQRYYPTHGAPIESPQDYVAAIKAHRDQRDRSILAALSSMPKSIIEITKEVYTDIDPALHVAASFNVRAHLERHLGLGTVAEVNENYILTPPAHRQP
ncbi:MAG: MBL fold metallo-hydrolase, partial [Pseudomonadota bacterium]